MSTERIINQIIGYLPKYPEEGNYSVKVSTESIIESICRDGEFDRGEVNCTIKVVETLFNSLCLFDSHILSKGYWQFCSFPAQLMARSLLDVMANNKQRFFDPVFWTSEMSGEILEKQRNLLRFVETNRVRNHADNKPNPIRFVNVSWGFIVVDGEVLFNHREDSRRTDIPNYVPVGGRLILDDIEGLSPNKAIDVLETQNTSTIKSALMNTLIREVEEETGLLLGHDYQLNDFMTLSPYCKVEGSGANHAYTKYHVVIRSLDLTKTGFFKLMEKMEKTKDLVFFNFDSIVKGRRSDGKTAFVEALHNSFINSDDLLNKLNELPNSFNEDYFSNENYTFPLGDGFLLRGKSGKETEISLGLSSEENCLLHILAWHAKGLDWNEVNPCVSLYRKGWLKIDDFNVLDLVTELARKLSKLGLDIIDIYGDSWVRIKLSPENIFFSDSLFSIKFESDMKGDYLEVTAESIDTVLGKTKEITVKKKIPEELFKKLVKINNSEKHSVVDDSSIDKQISRLDKEKQFSSIGLKKIVRTRKQNLLLFNQ